jgi:hypothetical protein
VGGATIQRPLPAERRAVLLGGAIVRIARLKVRDAGRGVRLLARRAPGITMVIHTRAKKAKNQIVKEPFPKLFSGRHQR